MALRALLLSPDDQAVHAITSVLEEMSVGCDRPLDGATAAKKLNSERFDLVLVDCENLPAAKLIFDVCRRSHGGASVPVAIVDGRAGLPTAFRLGAELILTKPVAKDQARVTIRTAVSRTKKDHPVHEAGTADIADGIGQEKTQESTAPKALAAAEGAASRGPEFTVAAAVETPAVSLQPPVAAPAATSTSVEIESSDPVDHASTAPTASTTAAIAAQPAVVSPGALSLSEIPTVPAPSTRAVPREPELSERRVTVALEKKASSEQSPILTSFEESKPGRGRGLMVATLLLALAGGVGYAGWMYQPGFRTFIQFRIEQGKTLLGLELKRAAVTARPATSAVPVMPAIEQPTPQQAASSPTQSPAAGTGSAAVNPLTVAPQAVNNSPASTAAASEPAPAADTSTAEPQKKTVALAGQTSDFSEAKNAVILSSKGAEKRLLHRVAPVVSAEVRKKSAEATVVLKALIDENGAVEALQPVEGNAALADAAMKAVKQWRYKPYTRDGKALPFQTVVLVDLQ